MQRILASLCAGLFIFSTSSAQTAERIHAPGDQWDVRDVTVKSISKVARSATLRGEPAVEIELFSPHPLYVGGMEWVLRVGNIDAQWPVRRGHEGTETLTYTLSVKDWKKLRSGDPLFLGWGGAGRVPFARLNKKMLRKK